MRFTIELDLAGARDLAAICDMFAENVETDTVPELDENGDEAALDLERDAKHYKTARRVADELNATLTEALT